MPCIWVGGSPCHLEKMRVILSLQSLIHALPLSPVSSCLHCQSTNGGGVVATCRHRDEHGLLGRRRRARRTVGRCRDKISSESISQHAKRRKRLQRKITASVNRRLIVREVHQRFAIRQWSLLVTPVTPLFAYLFIERQLQKWSWGKGQ